jgi:uncharacterized damage-inducible protein DinB
MTVSKRAQELLADLEAAAAELEAAARAVPAPLFHQRPAAEEWSAGEILAHMANSPRFYVSEVRRLLQEGGGTFGRPPDHPSRLDPVRLHGGDSLEQALASNREGVATARDLLQELTDRDLAVPARHPRAGEYDVDGLIARFIITHRRIHAQQIRENVVTLEGA